MIRSSAPMGTWSQRRADHAAATAAPAMRATPMLGLYRVRSATTRCPFARDGGCETGAEVAAGETGGESSTEFRPVARATRKESDGARAHGPAPTATAAIGGRKMHRRGRASNRGAAAAARAATRRRKVGQSSARASRTACMPDTSVRSVAGGASPAKEPEHNEAGGDQHEDAGGGGASQARGRETCPMRAAANGRDGGSAAQLHGATRSELSLPRDCGSRERENPRPFASTCGPIGRSKLIRWRIRCHAAAMPPRTPTRKRPTMFATAVGMDGVHRERQAGEGRCQRGDARAQR